MAGEKRQSIYFVLVTIFIDAMGYGIAGPVLPRLIMSIGHHDASTVHQGKIGDINRDLFAIHGINHIFA